MSEVQTQQNCPHCGYPAEIGEHDWSLHPGGKPERNIREEVHAVTETELSDNGQNVEGEKFFQRFEDARAPISHTMESMGLLLKKIIIKGEQDETINREALELFGEYDATEAGQKYEQFVKNRSAAQQSIGDMRSRFFVLEHLDRDIPRLRTDRDELRKDRETESAKCSELSDQKYQADHELRIEQDRNPFSKIFTRAKRHELNERIRKLDNEWQAHSTAGHKIEKQDHELWKTLWQAEKDQNELRSTFEHDLVYDERRRVKKAFVDAFAGPDVDAYLSAKLASGTYADSVINREAGPLFAELQAKGELSAEQIELFTRTVKEFFANGIRGETKYGQETEQRALRWTFESSLRNMDQRLVDVYKRILDDSALLKPPPEYYTPQPGEASQRMINCVSELMVRNKLLDTVSELEKRIGSPSNEQSANLRYALTQGSFTENKEFGGDAFKMLEHSGEQWKEMGKLLVSAGVIPKSELARLNDGLIQGIDSYYLDRPAQSNARDAIERLKYFGEAEAMPYLSKYLKHAADLNSGYYEREVSAEAIDYLARTIRPGDVERVLPLLPDGAKKLVMEARDPQSFLNRFPVGENNGRSWMLSQHYRMGDAYVPHSELAKQLSESGATEERVKRFYTRDFMYPPVEGVKVLERVVAETGGKPADYANLYLPIFIDNLVNRGSSLLIFSPDIPEFIQEFSKFSGDPPVKIWQAIEAKLGPSDRQAEYPEDFITALPKVAEICGLSRTQLFRDNLQRFIRPVYNKISESPESGLELVKQLAEAGGLSQNEVDLAFITKEAENSSYSLSERDRVLINSMANQGERGQDGALMLLARDRFGADAESLRTMEAIVSKGSLADTSELRADLIEEMIQLQRIPNGKLFFNSALRACREQAVDGRQLLEVIKLYDYLHALRTSFVDQAESGTGETGTRVETKTMFDDFRGSVFEQLRQAGQRSPAEFFRQADRQLIVRLFGEKTVGLFLDALPKSTDEKRNAFTHNEYDRTSQFLQNIAGSKDSSFAFGQEEWPVLTAYVKKFGLSQTGILYNYFKQFKIHESTGQPLPEYLVASGITSEQEMLDRYRMMRERVFSRTPIEDIGDLSPFEIELLSSVSGKSTHRFDAGRPSMENIIADFKDARDGGRIAPLPEGYEPFMLNLQNVEVQMEEEKIKGDFDVLRAEILGVLDRPGNLEGLREQAKAGIEKELASLEQAIQQKGDNQFVRQRMSQLQDIGVRLGSSQNLDSLLGTLLDVELNSAKKMELLPVMRQALLQRLLEKNYSVVQADQLSATLRNGMSVDGVLRILTLHDDFIKDHLLNVNRKNEEHYWSDETWEKINRGRKSSKHVNLAKVFEPNISALREASANFKVIEQGSAQKIEVIPDRGLVGELSGYLADVCYTAEKNMLERFPNVVPFKFVARDAVTGEAEFIGSVLMFEVKDAQGENALLVRGFDVPNESKYDMPKFIEKFIDQMQVVAQRRGIKKIILPGTAGAMSNYAMTNRHIESRYKQDRAPTSLSERFAFNSYDITNNVYVARQME